MNTLGKYVWYVQTLRNLYDIEPTLHISGQFLFLPCTAELSSKFRMFSPPKAENDASGLKACICFAVFVEFGNSYLMREMKISLADADTQVFASAVVAARREL